MLNNRAVVSVTGTAEVVLKKLKKSETAVFSFKKSGAQCLFSVNGKDLKKVFAIFGNPCYNVKVIKGGLRQRLKSALILRAGLVAGAVFFAAAAVFANSFVLKIEVGGSGSYLEPEVRRIIYAGGAGEFKRYSLLNVSEATGKILALPQVTFCNIEKRGSVLKIDVRTDEEHYGTVNARPLVSDCDGVVKNVVAVCGTAAVQVGASVSKGEVLIDARNAEGGECLAVGYAEIERTGVGEYFAECESEENLKAAFSSVLLENEEIITRKSTVKPTEGGVIYVISFTSLHTISINME